MFGFNLYLILKAQCINSLPIYSNGQWEEVEHFSFWNNIFNILPDHVNVIDVKLMSANTVLTSL